jgi:hypothetical protein
MEDERRMTKGEVIRSSSVIRRYSISNLQILQIVIH